MRIKNEIKWAARSHTYFFGNHYISKWWLVHCNFNQFWLSSVFFLSFLALTIRLSMINGWIIVGSILLGLFMNWSGVLVGFTTKNTLPYGKCEVTALIWTFEKQENPFIKLLYLFLLMILSPTWLSSSSLGLCSFVKS
jgi:hypothetical protein